MTRLSPMDTLEIEVKNFGPITDAKIDLRPFTLFVGPSNSGKSYFSTLIYALHRAMSEEYRRPHGAENFEWKFPPRHVQQLRDWLDSNFEESKEDSSTESNSISMQKSFELPKEISRLVRPALGACSHYGVAVKDEIQRCFGAESIRSLIHRSGSRRRAASSKATVTLKKNTKSYRNSLKSLVCIFELNEKNSNCSLNAPQGVPLHIWGPKHHWGVSALHRSLSDGALLSEILWEGPSGRGFRHKIIKNYLVDAVLTNSIDPIGRSAHYLPADRTGLMHAHRIIVNTVMERATQAGIHPLSNVPVLSGVIVDFLEQLAGINDDSSSFRRGEWHKFIRSTVRDEAPAKHLELLREVAKNLELGILGGDVHSESSNDLVTSYPNLSYTPRGWNDSLPLMLASSMVSELSPIVLYLRHVVTPGDVLIIEEPEAHLHPDLQVKFVNVLAEIVKADVQIILTTHSEWVLDTVANLVLSSEVDKQSANGTSAGLASRDVGIWSFEPGKQPKGSTVQEIKFDFEKGGFVTEFENVAVDIYNRWAELGNRINKKAGKLSNA